MQGALECLAELGWIRPEEVIDFKINEGTLRIEKGWPERAPERLPERR